jgi:hypothetical protein
LYLFAKRAEGLGRNVIERFSLPEAFFEGTLMRRNFL